MRLRLGIRRALTIVVVCALAAPATAQTWPARTVRIMPPAHLHVCSTWIQFIGTEGALFVDDTHRDVTLSTMKNGIVYPMASMPGERVEHTYVGPMESETVHFIEAVAFGRPVLVTAEQARQVMEVCIAADLSADRNEPVRLPLPESRVGAFAV